MNVYLIIILLFLISPFDCDAQKALYISIDQYGNKQFSDVPPDLGTYTIEKQQSIATVKWHKSPVLKITPEKTKPRKNNEKALPTKSQLCTIESQQIKQLENRLKQKLKTQLFDELKEKLRNLRWQHHKKSC